jgi:hypothetical protein
MHFVRSGVCVWKCSGQIHGCKNWSSNSGVDPNAVLFCKTGILLTEFWLRLCHSQFNVRLGLVWLLRNILHVCNGDQYLLDYCVADCGL